MPGTHSGDQGFKWKQPSRGSSKNHYCQLKRSYKYDFWSVVLDHSEHPCLHQRTEVAAMTVLATHCQTQAGMTVEGVQRQTLGWDHWAKGSLGDPPGSAG